MKRCVDHIQSTENICVEIETIQFFIFTSVSFSVGMLYLLVARTTMMILQQQENSLLLLFLCAAHTHRHRHTPNNGWMVLGAFQWIQMCPNNNYVAFCTTRTHQTCEAIACSRAAEVHTNVASDTHKITRKTGRAANKMENGHKKYEIKTRARKQASDRERKNRWFKSFAQIFLIIPKIFCKLRWNFLYNFFFFVSFSHSSPTLRSICRSFLSVCWTFH